MRNKYLAAFLLISCAGAFVFISPSSAVEDTDELYPTITTKEEYPYAEEEAVDRSNLNFSASATGGYDTNIRLEHYDPTASFFAQSTFGVEGTHAISDHFTLRAGYDVTSIKYFRESEPDLLDNIFTAGLDVKLYEGLLCFLDYNFDYVAYPHDKAIEYTVNEVETGFRQDITEKVFHKLTYRFSFKHYPKWKTRNTLGVVSPGDRKDLRNTLEHQLGVYVDDKTLIRSDNTLYFNNSNEHFLDFYDYRVFKTKATVIRILTEKLYGSANFAYQRKAYGNRVVSDRVNGDQRDNLLMGGASLFYDLTSNLSIGTSFDYRRNFSNEGAQKYKDYILSGGVYSNF